MRTAAIDIDGVIGEDTYSMMGGVTLQMVKEYVKQQGEFDELTVFINSVGGGVYEGFAIYDYLRSLNVKIKTVVMGNCMSIATVIFLAGDERYMSRNSQFMIHNPWTSISGDADELKRQSEGLRMVEDRLARFYTDKVGIKTDEVKQMMSAETFMSLEKAMEMGFVHGEYQVRAVAYFNDNNKQMDNMDSKIKRLVDELKNYFAPQNEGENVSGGIAEGTTPQNMTLKLSSGATVFVEGAEDGDLIGKKIFMVEDGEITETPAPDGEHELEGGSVIVVQDGIVTEAREESNAMTDEEKEKEKMLAEIENLKNHVAELTSKNEEYENAINAARNESEQRSEELEKIKANNKKIEAKFNELIMGLGELPENNTPTNQSDSNERKPNNFDSMAEALRNLK